MASAPAVPAAPALDQGNALVGAMRKAGGGGGKGPTPLEVAQVVAYRSALVVAALCWVVIFNLDFFMRGGLSELIDGSLQRQLLALADVCAGVAALAAPAGSRIAVGFVLRVLGLATLAAAVAGYGGLESLGSLAGPACMVLVGAREIYWFGFREKGSAAACCVLFLLVALFRATAILDPGSTLLNPPDDGEEFSWIQRGIPCVGPPLLLSFPTTLSLSGLAFGKVLLEAIADDLNEEGELWSKPLPEDEVADGKGDEDEAA